MTYILPFLRTLQSEQKAMDMDWPPPPPSPFDEIGHSKSRIQVRRKILRLMKEKFPGLPY